jgi:hypothetical protein
MTREKRVSPDAAYAGTETSRSRNYTPHPISGDRRQQFDPLAANGRRHAHSRRMPPLGTCGDIRDPDHDRHRCGNEISYTMAGAAVANIAHLDRLGTPAVLDARTCDAIAKLGYERLASVVRRRSAGLAA